MTPPSSSNPLAQSIEAVVRNTSNQIEAFDRSQFIRSQVPVALKVMLVIPLIAIGAQAIRWYLGFSASPILSWTAWLALTIVTPVVWLFAQGLFKQLHVNRLRAIRAADKKLGASERLETADDFVSQSEQNGFMQAAIEDAQDWAVRGQAVELQNDQADATTSLGFWAIPIAIVFLIAAALLSNLQRDIAPVELAGTESSGKNELTNVVAEAPKPQTEVKPEEPEPKEEPPRTDTPNRENKAVNRQGSAGTAIPDVAEESAGKLSEGETRESQQSANPSNAKGSPSASGQPSKSGDEKKRKKKPPKKIDNKEREKKERKQEDKPSGATAGQGSSKGSDNNAAPSDWASTSQAATPDDEDLEEEDEVDDEEEEQESRGGVQPNMRDRRTPVNRDLQIGFGSNRPNPDANGRGGPGGQKKSRGVASLVLGVPIPDRVNGQPNKGRIRITQQRITPETESSQPIAAESRPQRDSEVGQIHHPEFTPWMHDYVRRFFLEQRAKHPLNSNTTSGSNPEANDS
ncbi:MAG: hypothetical protein AAF483_14905 [Planctomycetota bacterium]